MFVATFKDYIPYLLQLLRISQKQNPTGTPFGDTKTGINSLIFNWVLYFGDVPRDYFRQTSLDHVVLDGNKHKTCLNQGSRLH